MSANVAAIIGGVGRFYAVLIIAYVLLSWLPMRGIVYDVHHVLGSVVEPYLGLFRRFIPPLGNVDISPIIALLVLQVIVNYVLIPLALRL